MKYFLSKKYFSVCVDNIYKKDIFQYFYKNQSLTVDEIENLVKENIWNKNETFYFVNYPSPSNPGFECMTTKDSVDSNEPCMFPYNWKGNPVNNCSYDKIAEEEEPWCLTKLNKNHTMFKSQQWGNCRKECDGGYQ